MSPLITGNIDNFEQLRDHPALGWNSNPDSGIFEP